jgi:L-ascorbate metabolism protein UlaG (beta-lactamase superfamily)
MKLTYYGHSCFSVFAGGKNILFDPFITPNEMASAIDVDAIKADYIFISHGHYDHIFDAVRIANNTGAMVLGNFEIYDWLNKQGLKNTHPINPGGKFSFDFGIAKAVTAIHSSSFPDGTYAGVAAGYVLNTPDGNFYYSGDTGLSLDMQLIPKWVQPRFAVLPIGDGLTMGVEDAITMCGYINVKKVIGVHYDTFGFITIDHQKAIDAFKEAGIELLLMDIGSTIDI